MVSFDNLDSPPQIKTTTTFKPDNKGQLEQTNQKVTVTTTRSSKKAIPPLFSFQLTNPIVYIKSWWKRIIGNEGIKLTLQIKPLTAMALTLVISGTSFGLGRITVPQPLFQYVTIFATPKPTPLVTPNLWKETAYSGKLQVSGTRYFLLTNSSEAITLEVPEVVNLSKLVGKRIMAVGLYNDKTRVMQVSDAKDLEILPNSPIPLPTVATIPTIVPVPMGNL